MSDNLPDDFSEETLGDKAFRLTHRHAFSVPVEWKEIRDDSQFADFIVTKLRCSGCNEEIKR